MAQFPLVLAAGDFGDGDRAKPGHGRDDPAVAGGGETTSLCEPTLPAHHEAH